MQSHRLGKYACLEIERRFLLRELPPELVGSRNGWRITDRYISGTRLRLRRMKSLEGNSVVYKLGQKFRAEGQGQGERTMTTMYLEKSEYDQLLELEGRELRKIRYPFERNGLTYGIDVFEGSLKGLILAEIECRTREEFTNLKAPNPEWVDITEIDFYTGGQLSSISKEELFTMMTDLFP